jgi:hypothetical protein
MWNTGRHKDCADNHIDNSSSSDDHIHHCSSPSPAHDNPAASATNDRRPCKLLPLDRRR